MTTRRFFRSQYSILHLATICLMGWTAAAAEGPVPFQADGDQVYQTAESEKVTIELVTYPEKFRRGFESDAGPIYSIFTANGDSTFWCGPNRPNPYSWLSISIICRAPTDFQIHFSPEQGAPVDTLRFGGIEPGPYRVQIGEKNRPPTGKYLLRFNHDGEAVDEKMVHLVDR